MKVQDMLVKIQEKENSNVHQFEVRISDSIDKIKEAANTSKTIKDAYGNSLLSIGNKDVSDKFSEYTFSNDTLNWPLWLALYNESWVFRRTIDKPAQDEIRCGITLLNNNKKTETQRYIKKYYDDLIQLLQWGAIFGGSLMFAMFDNFNDNDYKEAYNEKKVKQCKSMKFYVVDRWYGVAPDYNNIVNDMSDPDFGKPKYYNVTMENGKTFRYHHDYVIRYEHRFAPKFVKQGMLQGWGYSEGSHILNELSRDEKLKSSIQSLVDKSLIEVIKMSGMRGIFMGADEQNETQLTKRLEMVNWGRNFNSLTFLDKDDEYQMNNFSGLGGLSDLLQQNMWQIAAAVEMQGVLFGDMKQGFGTDSDALERYDETIQGRCESYVRPVYEKLLRYIYTILDIHEKPDFEFNSLLEKKHKEEKMTKIQSFINMCGQLLGDGIISTTQYAKALKTFIDKDNIDFDLTESNIKKLEEESQNQMEGLDFELDTNSDI